MTTRCQRRMIRKAKQAAFERRLAKRAAISRGIDNLEVIRHNMATPKGKSSGQLKSPTGMIADYGIKPVKATREHLLNEKGKSYVTP